ncbi:16630_t:CDS:2, partial [Dentiscutata heterogama]
MIFGIEELVHIKGETVTLAVVIVQTSYTKELIFEVDLVEMLKSIGGKVIHKGKKLKAHHGDHYGGQHSFFLVSDCPVVDELHGVFTRTKQSKGTIGIIVSPSIDSFTPDTINAVLEIAEPPEPSEPELLEQLPPYPIIVTDIDRLPKYLINTVLD